MLCIERAERRVIREDAGKCEDNRCDTGHVLYHVPILTPNTWESLQSEPKKVELI